MPAKLISNVSIVLLTFSNFNSAAKIYNNLNSSFIGGVSSNQMDGSFVSSSGPEYVDPESVDLSSGTESELQDLEDNETVFRGYGSHGLTSKVHFTTKHVTYTTSDIFGRSKTQVSTSTVYYKDSYTASENAAAGKLVFGGNSDDTTLFVGGILSSMVVGVLCLI
ncbi:hypothetical protein DASC09_062870 [Saccharomycopsis crataegensis]|uniref:Uncharacterized protein n=1 Tax=Saccharomycopsis crataegensis TaxID=43959 RepID=A0AAV5QVS4_9ASCO|nr:hypothetical protein DASC09_062870 [Saccharomycopsis crataegensis]